MEIRKIEKPTKKNIKIRQTEYNENNNFIETITSLENKNLPDFVQNIVNEIASTKTKNKTINEENFKKDNIHKNHRQRLKNQFLENGLQSLTDIQKLELLLFFAIPQKDTNPIAHQLINEFGSIKNVFNADYHKLMEVSGIKENSALLIKLLNSFYPAINTPNDIQQINTAYEAKEFCKNLFVGKNIEEFYVICLNKNNSIKKFKLIQKGTADEIIIPIRNITEFAIENKCGRIIITHNHPEGIAAMSDEDCTFTYSLVCSCLLNSIEIIDHIIVGINGAISLASQNYLPKIKEKAYNTLNIPKEKILLISSESSEYILDKE